MGTAGWSRDPTGRYQVRYHDGERWTDHVATDGVQATDAFAGTTGRHAPATDPEPIWAGHRQALSASATGGAMAKARYRLTHEHLVFEAGLLSTNEERVPLWTLGDIDVEQSMNQRARNIGDVSIRVLENHHTARSQLKLEAVADPQHVRDLVDQYARAARARHLGSQHTTTVEHVGSPGVPVATPAGAPDPMVMLAELHRLQIITAEELSTFIQRAAARR